MIFAKILTVFGFLVPFLLNAQSTITAEYVTGEIKIDGELTENAWNTTEKINNLTQVEPNPGMPSLNRTEVQILRNSDFLYFGGTCYLQNRGEGIRVPDLKRDFNVSESDAFGIILDLLNDKRNATAFFINPLAVQRDEMVFSESVSDENWNTKWSAATRVYDSCWTFEIAIPWSSIRYMPSTDSFGINFIRIDRTTNELSAWVPYPRTFSMFRLQYSGVLKGINPPPPGREIRFTPYMLLQNNLTGNNGSNKSTAGQYNSFKPGGDLKWAVNSNTVLDLTLNTDFAQVNEDRDIINLTGFDISLPEQRQFFLENAGLFQSGDVDGNIKPFFSRKVGIDDNGVPVPMDGGLRFVYRGRGSSYGMLSAMTHIPDSVRSIFLTGRYLQNYGEQNKIGLLVSGRRDKYSGGNKNNLVTAADGFIRFKDNLSLDWMSSGSVLSQTGMKGIYGYSGAANINYLTENLHLYFKNYTISENYTPGSGFISTDNIAAFEAGTDLYLRPDWKPGSLRSIEPGFYITNNRNLGDGSLRQFYLTIWPVYFLFQNGMVISAKWLPTWEYLKENFMPAENVNIENGKYFYNRYGFKLNSDPSAHFNYLIEYSTGSYFDGHLNKLTSQIKYSPIPNISVSVNNESDWLKKIGKLNKDITIDVVSAELSLSLNARLGVTTFYQYNSENSSSFSTIKFSWEYSPLSYFYILFNSSDLKDIPGTHMTEGQLLIKVSHQFQI